MNLDDLGLTLTVAQAARLIGVSRNSAYEAVRRGEIPSVRVGRRILIPTGKLLSLFGHEPAALGEALPAIQESDPDAR